MDVCVENEGVEKKKRRIVEKRFGIDICVGDKGTHKKKKKNLNSGTKKAVS